MRWIWIDHFEEFISGESARAVKTVSMAEDHLHEQYPCYPIMPHSLIIEGLAQTGGILVGEANQFSEKVVLAKVPQVEFFDHATPGDVLHYEVKLVQLYAEGAITEAQVLRDGKLFAKGEIVFAHLDKSRAIDDESSPKNFVFTKDHLMALLRMASGTYQTGGQKTRLADEPVPNSDGHGSNNGRP